jgi:hypothetical protein
MFAKIKTCPFCGSNKFKNFLNKNLSTNFYVKEIILDLDISFSLLKKKLKKKKCKICHTIFFSTWFNDFIKKKIFLSIYGQHNMGWQNFYDFKSKLLSPNHGELFQGLKKLIKFKTYGEYGCPFNGLFFDMLKEEVIKNVNLKEYIKLNMLHLSSKVRNFNRNKKIKKNRISIPKINRVYRKIFVIDDSNLIWGKNDISQNCSSLALADKIFDFHLFNSNEKKLFENKIDLFGFFMTLDHCEKPLQLLNKILNISKYVIIHAHTSDDITAQHGFFLTKKIKYFLETKKIYNIDITQQIEKDRSRNKGINYKVNEIYLLCSKNKNKIDNINTNILVFNK